MTERTPQDEQAHTDEIEHIKRFVSEHGRPVALGLGLVLAVAVAFAGYRSYKHARREKASLMLSSGSKIQDLEALVEQYSSVPAVSVAMLKLAKAYYDAGDYDAAMSQYEEFRDKYPDHVMRPAAALGLLHCREAKGYKREALQGFVAFADRHPDHFLTPQAVFGQGRCLEALGRLEEARAVYEDFIAQQAGSAWVPRAEELLSSVNHRLEEAGDAENLEGAVESEQEGMLTLPTGTVTRVLQPAPTSDQAESSE